MTNTPKKFDELKIALNLSSNYFMRTTDPRHLEAAQEFWRLCDKNGDIYKKNYKLKYCIGCELEKTDSELQNGRCLIHPNLEIEILEEENYFFRFSKYQKNLLALYEKTPPFVVPAYRLEEIRSFVKKGLQDFSISRLKSKMPWGVDVPGDPRHVMYVWFDALVYYISTLGWPKNLKNFKDFWPGVQVAGKDNLRQQTAIWQAMLFSAGLPNSQQVFIHGFITSSGQKMSKSLGNVINPFDLVSKYGTDAVRYYLLREIPAADDGDFSFARMEEIYNSDLANELGNLVSRLTTLGEQDELNIGTATKEEFSSEIKKQFASFQFNIILEQLWTRIKDLNKKVDTFAPWNKTKDKRKDFLFQCFNILKSIAFHLQPFIPETAEKILQVTSGKIKKISPLFPRFSSVK